MAGRKPRNEKELQEFRARAEYAHKVFLDKTPERQAKRKQIEQEIREEEFRNKVKKTLRKRRELMRKANLRRKDAGFKANREVTATEVAEKLSAAVEASNAEQTVSDHFTYRPDRYHRDVEVRPTLSTTPTIPQAHIIQAKPPQNPNDKPKLK